MNKKKYEEPSVIDNSVINTLIYFNIFQFGKKFLNKLDSPCEQACMSNPKKNYDLEAIKYQQLRIEKPKGKYDMKLSKRINSFNDNNNRHLSKLKI